MGKIRTIFKITRNMGGVYLFYYATHRIKLVLGILQKQTSYIDLNEISEDDILESSENSILESFKNSKGHFLFSSSDFTDRDFGESVENYLENYKSNIFTFFFYKKINLDQRDLWLRSPDTGYLYDASKHWTKIEDFSKESGDIKYVWEPSRFQLIYDLVRQHHCSRDAQEKVEIEEYFLFIIEDWIDKNPINKGPNYKCSQEISIRLMAWFFGIYYFEPFVIQREGFLLKFFKSVYFQVLHVENNISFSMHLVKNNHSITETLLIYATGFLFPFLKGANHRRSKGKKLFLNEVKYQLFEDGSFIQYSFNYQRVALQLMTWCLYLCRNNDETLPEWLTERVKKLVLMLYSMQDEVSLKLPNYGANDGSIFYKLNSCEYRDYSPQIQCAYNYFFPNEKLYENKSSLEDSFWFNRGVIPDCDNVNFEKAISFPTSGYYRVNSVQNSFLFFRCGKHHYRPSQSDNFHVDIWDNGKNIIRDSGSYKYNTADDMNLFFKGSKSHNVVIIDGENQMEKGPRFVWLNWSQANLLQSEKREEWHILLGELKAYQHIDNSIRHKRAILCSRYQRAWIIIDILKSDKVHDYTQNWNLNDSFHVNHSFESYEKSGKRITEVCKPGFDSSYYGNYEKRDRLEVTQTGKEVMFYTLIYNKEIEKINISIDSKSIKVLDTRFEIRDNHICIF